MKTIVIQKRNFFPGTLGADNRARPVTRNGRVQKPLVFNSPAKARAWLVREKAKLYGFSHGETSRPECWIVPADKNKWIKAVISDRSLLNWNSCGCTAGEDGSPCRLCDTCTDWLEGQIEAQLREAAIPNNAKNA